MTPQKLFSEAITLHQSGRLAEAEGLYRQLVATSPRAFSPHHMLGVLLAQQGRFAEAGEMMRIALKLNPHDPAARVNFGNVLHSLGRFEEAVESYDRALETRPDADTWNNRGNALHRLHRLDEAMVCFDEALALEPKNLQALYKRAVMLGELGRTDEALAAYDSVLSLKPDHVQAFNNRGYLLWLHNRDYSKAIADLERALVVMPDLPYGAGELLHMKMYAADWTNYESEKARLVDGVRGSARVARPFMFEAIADRPQDLQVCSRVYARDQYPEFTGTPHDPTTRKNRDKIRVGYVSGEFRMQATAILMAGLYERHDRNRFEVVAIDNSMADNSAMATRLKQAFDEWIDIEKLDDVQAAAKIRKAEIDILINLNGYFGQHRMGVFAHRPAPLQVNYLGFPGTLGATYIDYIIADAVVIPPEEQCFYDEQVVTLPGCYQVNDDRGRQISARRNRAEAGLPEQGFVFCNFNQSYKLTPETFACWMRILRRADDSVLWLRQAATPFPENIARHARAHGVDPARILFAPVQPLDQHLARLSLADVFLDGLPYNAHTTGSDALWAGVPILTRLGTTFPGRVAASLLYAAGLPELVTHNLEEYEDLAVTLATDHAELKKIKSKLTKNCSLFDTDLFRRNIEAVYTRMWEYWLAGRKPHVFKV